MLEPVGLSPMETLLPRTGEGSNVKPGGKEGSRGCAPYWVSCATISGPQNPPSPVYLPQAGLLELVPLPPPSAHSWLSAGPCSPSRALALGLWENYGEGLGFPVSRPLFQRLGGLRRSQWKSL